jgi:hypothetical protein
MDKFELIEALTTAGVARSTYIVAGIEFPHANADPYVTLKEEDGRWVVGVWERGVFWVDSEHDSEDAACRRMYEMLTWVAPPRVSRTPEQESASRELNAEIQARNKRDLAERLARYESEHGK